MKKFIGATFTLEEVAEHFKQWRNVKKKGERIPERLWSEAIALVGTYGVSQVAQSLHLSGTDLNKRRGIVGTGKRRRGAGGKTVFMEVAPARVDQTLGAQTDTAWMELERPDGLRLRIRPSGGADLLALVDRFMGV